MAKDVYLTREGKARFEAELHELITVSRREVEDRIRSAVELADGIDDAEAIMARQDQAFVEGRIQEIERVLANAEIIEEPRSSDYVRLGSHVTVTSSDGDETYQIVGSPQADPRGGLVSNESPIGRALLGKRVGDDVTIVAPAGSFDVTIKAIN